MGMHPGLDTDFTAWKKGEVVSVVTRSAKPVMLDERSFPVTADDAYYTSITQIAQRPFTSRIKALIDHGPCTSFPLSLMQSRTGERGLKLEAGLYRRTNLIYSLRECLLARHVITGDFLR